ncbi:hydroxysteroid 11-beta-dehydrogenase 1-like protein isoform X3 [Harpia harpyja]|uniref:hydroxysteroid 11-beta-dehydrogenase 1-like protein isoform X3 n=1 Tax=Harpia harpyja TaxID=202280 RepID=UPI0022B1699A|nr:hydroxysteroid 11-beta-dehydrogenase 1-like protein isoform X3 [Harpia harpyja]
MLTQNLAKTRPAFAVGACRVLKPSQFSVQASVSHFFLNPKKIQTYSKQKASVLQTLLSMIISVPWVTLAPSGETSQVESQFYTVPLLHARQKRPLHASCRLASSIRGRHLQYFGWSAQLQDFTLFFTSWWDMKPIGKVLCATGIIAGLLAFFWKDTFNPESLSGARVLLTGASAGIGEQMAYHYAKFGAEIVLTARREAVLQKVVEKCLTLGAKKIFYIPADMSSPSEPEKVVQFAVQKLGGLDYLVLNHIGVTHFQMWAGDVEYTRWLMQVNFFSYVALATAALPTLEKNKGSLVVVSSLTGKIPTPFTTSYSATKFALDGFFSSLRHELIMQNRNISVTLCILGLIDTDTALENTRGKVHLTASPAPEAALAIIRGGATRVQEVFYPWWLQHMCCLWVLFPNDRDQVLRSYYNYSSP